MIRKYIEKIVQNGNQQEMEELSEMLQDVMYKLKEYDHDCYKKYKNKLKGMAYDYKIDKELAYEIVENMKPLGKYWDMETVASVIGNSKHSLEDMYVVMNSLANDYQTIISLEDTETYINMAHAWLDDVDGHTNKIWWYFVK